MSAAKQAKEYGKPIYVSGGIIRPRAGKYQAEVNSHGRRRRKTFESRANAEAWVKSKRQDIQAKGASAVRLTESQMVDASEAIRRADGAVSLNDAIRFWLSHNKPKGGTRTVLELYNDYYQSKVRAKRRDRTLTDIRNRVGRFANDKEYSGMGVHLVTPEMLQHYVDSLKAEPLNHWNYVLALRGFFKYGIKKRLIENNPAADLEKPTLDEGEIEFMSVRDIRKVLSEAERLYPETAITLAIQFFTGVRTSEVVQLKWSDVNFVENSIKIRPTVSKKHRLRHVEIKPNLKKWLVHYRKKSGNISSPYMTFRRHRRDIIKHTGVEWVNNACRHSFATYHLTAFEDAAKTAFELGHKDAGLLYNNYRGLTTHADAKEFWKIEPEGEPKIIPLHVKEA